MTITKFDALIESEISLPQSGKFVTKPIIVEATQFLIYEKTKQELRDYCKNLNVIIRGPSNVLGLISFYLNESAKPSLLDGDWIVKFPDGHREICREQNFENLYKVYNDKH